jgi:ADP-ribosylglycohydrolase
MAWCDKRLCYDVESIVERASALTHAHERSKLACKIYALLLFHLLGCSRKDVVTLALDTINCRYMDHAEYPHFERLLSEDFDKLSVNDIKSSGYVVDSLEAAVWCLLTTDNYKECVLKAVNLGEDTDTIAAIAGGLAGALYGYDSIPKEWLNTLLRRDYIEQLCHRAAIAWA